MDGSMTLAGSARIFSTIQQRWSEAMREPTFMRWRSLAEMITSAYHLDNDPGLLDLASDAWRIANNIGELKCANN